MEINKSSRIETEKHTTYTLSGSDILKMFEKYFGEDVPPDAEVVFTVPGGGNWSGLDVDIDEDHPVLIKFTERNTEYS